MLSDASDERKQERKTETLYSTRTMTAYFHHIVVFGRRSKLEISLRKSSQLIIVN